ncbi:hypothetical protein LguiA_015042 [Lonicera macranthoides]
MLMTSFSSSKTFFQNPQKPVSIRATIMHRNAKGSPLHDPNATVEEIIEKDFQISKERAKYYYRKSSPKSTESIQADTEILEGSFIMKFKIGTPAIDTYGYIDTGSALSWVQCAPCMECYEQWGTIYNRKRSSSYISIPWGHQMCSDVAIGGSVEDVRGDCGYTLTYIDKSQSFGILGVETFTFQEGYEVTDVLFGCSDFSIRDDYSPPALIGLGDLRASLVWQLSISQFYYYVEHSEESTNMIGHIHLGVPVLDPLFSIPLLPNRDTFYYLPLESITVAGERLVLSEIVIDSGATYSVLVKDIYDGLVRAISNAMGGPLADYKGNCYGNIRKAPAIVFEFKNRKISICQSNVWYRMGSVYCLAFRESPVKGRSIFGMYQQRNMRVAYDLESGHVSMTYMHDTCPSME